MIDIYVRLVLATLTFVAPLMSLFISFFSKNINEWQKKSEEKRKNIEEEHLAQLQGGQSVTDTVQKSAQDMAQLDTATRRERDLVNPKLQLSRMFLVLLVSLCCATLSYLTTNVILYSKFNLAHALLILSFGVYIYGLFIIREVLWNLIELSSQETKA